LHGEEEREENGREEERGRREERGVQ